LSLPASSTRRAGVAQYATRNGDLSSKLSLMTSAGTERGDAS
jgi:hypothetical protein